MRVAPVVRTLLATIVMLVGTLASGPAPALVGMARGADAGASPVAMTLPLVHRFALGLPTDDVAVLPLSHTLLLAQAKSATSRVCRASSVL